MSNASADAPTSQPNSKVPYRVVRGICVVVLLAMIAGAVYLFTGGRFHRLGMAWASSEINAYMNGGKHGIVARFLDWDQTADWGRYHRDALVKQGRLVHCQFRFEQIPCPSPEAHYLSTQVAQRQSGQAEAAFTARGRSSAGPIYEVNLWCSPEEVASWETWYEKNNDFSAVQAAMEQDEQLAKQAAQ
ncbi:hypothetical protein LOC68_25475 [Blastopirellula sp. JC732]|uniref:Uncharacterized protein n=1 Tax=Blastopirellula sediminis TaxID=2894196 RepID=A0A9X1MRY2_9BACT|nr:hypothetical protein [Blastopirellula sediminis]MCC9604939.1 hypothetical protein [Blastopirellula sediminis]MCC9631761.1 hypothetical protein [Blastopirellula sediminis]